MVDFRTFFLLSSLSYAIQLTASLENNAGFITQDIPPIETEFKIDYDTNGMSTISLNGSQRMVVRAVQVCCQKNGECSTYDKSGNRTTVEKNSEKPVNIEPGNNPDTRARASMNGHDTHLNIKKDAMICIEKKYGKIKRTYYNIVTKKIDCHELHPSIDMSNPKTYLDLQQEHLNPIYVVKK